MSALSTVSVSSAYTGGVVAYADSSELTNITSNVNVSIKDYEKGTWNYIGGIAGYARTTVIKNSQNLEILQEIEMQQVLLAEQTVILKTV